VTSARIASTRLWNISGCPRWPFMRSWSITAWWIVKTFPISWIAMAVGARNCIGAWLSLGVEAGSSPGMATSDLSRWVLELPSLPATHRATVTVWHPLLRPTCGRLLSNEGNIFARQVRPSPGLPVPGFCLPAAFPQAPGLPRPRRAVSYAGTVKSEPSRSSAISQADRRPVPGDGCQIRLKLLRIQFGARAQSRQFRSQPYPRALHGEI